MKTGNTNYIYKSDLDKACFQDDMAYGKFKDLNKRTQSDNVLRDTAFEIASNPKKHDGCQRGLTSMVYRSFDKKSTGSGITLKLNKINSLQMNFIKQSSENFKNEKFLMI